MQELNKSAAEEQGGFMKVKVFTDHDTERLEQAINVWLKRERPEIVDKQLTSLDALAQKEGYGRYIQITLMIWYK